MLKDKQVTSCTFIKCGGILYTSIYGLYFFQVYRQSLLRLANEKFCFQAFLESDKDEVFIWNLYNIICLCV